MTDLIQGYDASTPPWPVPAIYEVTGGYIGGATPHVWTADEWATKALKRKLPIYVPTYFHDGVLRAGSDAIDCVHALRSAGVPQGVCVGLDLETLIAPSYVEAFDNVVFAAGYRVVEYGSSSTIFKNPRTSGGYWVATRPHNPDFPGYGKLYPGSVMTQVQDLGPYDVDVIDADLVFWGDDVTPIPTPLPTYWTNTVIQNLPTLKQGDSGPLVRTLQGCLGARNHAVGIDGQFGPLTEEAVKAFQVAFNVPDSVRNGQGDGQVGQHTWTALITNVNQ